MARSTPANIRTNPIDPDDRHLNEDTGDEHANADDGEKDAENDRPVCRSTSSRSYRGNEVSIVVIEAALHLFEEALLVF